MEILRSGKTIFVDVVCAAGHDEDDEGIAFCDCPFFVWDDGFRACRLLKEPGDIDGAESKEELIESCPLTEHEVTAVVKLKR